MKWETLAGVFERVAQIVYVLGGQKIPERLDKPSPAIDQGCDAWIRGWARNFAEFADPAPELCPWLFARLVVGSTFAQEMRLAGQPDPSARELPATVQIVLIDCWHDRLADLWQQRYDFWQDSFGA